MNIYITGVYDNYTLSYKGYADDDGKRALINGKLSGTRTETEASAIGVALKYALDNYKNVHIYTTFDNAVKLANGEYKPIESRTKDFVKYVNKVLQSIDVSFTSGIPEEQMNLINGFGNNRERASAQNPFKEKPKTASAVGWRKKLEDYCVTVKDANGNVVCSLTNFDFNGKLADAIYFADWYEQEGKNPDSQFYGYTVERKGVPCTPKKKEPVKEVKAKERPAPEKEEKKKKELEQLTLF